jgi:hypothetical protein
MVLPDARRDHVAYGPDGIRIGKYVRYRSEDVDAWIEQQGAA